ncbi:MAG: hypothetical protein OXI39_02890 [Gemmatimonadota bacterium]|uniref:hypothetical protein n=1 Tax=Candidatus Palauibacter scopulicola TaxID=3056741 RepID=UPI00238337EB|nr:hypothetical protein [Candidatus Palauibacter scopulicola]MDE2661939.1 hypothetical protein [Candidatus Palauibacter scopulicola]
MAPPVSRRDNLRSRHFRGFDDGDSRDPDRAERWAAYDIRMRTYARLFDADLGPGGWDAINASHWAYIEAGLDRHRGESVRFLLTYGAGHKGPFLRELRKRDDIVLLNVAPFLDRLAAP